MGFRVAWVVLILAGVAGAQARYDLGGPCVEGRGPGPFGEIQRAEKRGEWDRAIELYKLSIRGMCSNEYLWERLVGALVAAGRDAEAVRVVQEMDLRGFDLTSLLVRPMPAHEPTRPEMAKFLNGATFRDSAIGKKVGAMLTESDVRRTKYQATLMALRPDQRPPDHYIAKGACPFECCRYGDWTAVAGTELVSAPGRKQVVGKVMKGSRVKALTGEVHVQPEPVVVLQDGPLAKGSIAFILDYHGEGSGAVYSQGKIVSIFHGYGKYCLKISDSCWGETILPDRKRRESEWWVKVRLPNGVVGWTDKTKNFSGQDGCG